MFIIDNDISSSLTMFITPFVVLTLPVITRGQVKGVQIAKMVLAIIAVFIFVPDGSKSIATILQRPRAVIRLLTETVRLLAMEDFAIYWFWRLGAKYGFLRKNDEGDEHHSIYSLFSPRLGR